MLLHKETGLGYSAEQRVLPLYLKINYELFTSSETSDKYTRVEQIDCLV